MTLFTVGDSNQWSSCGCTAGCDMCWTPRTIPETLAAMMTGDSLVRGAPKVMLRDNRKARRAAMQRERRRRKPPATFCRSCFAIYERGSRCPVCG